MVSPSSEKRLRVEMGGSGDKVVELEVGLRVTPFVEDLRSMADRPESLAEFCLRLLYE